jgi:hypothetical protein
LARKNCSVNSRGENRRIPLTHLELTGGFVAVVSMRSVSINRVRQLLMATMESILLELLRRLERLGENHEELYDSEAREQIGGLVMEGFVRKTPGFLIPERLGMLSEDADSELRRAISEYIEAANRLAEDIGLSSFHARLAAFQNPAVRTNPAVDVGYEELFGHTRPEWYDEAGNVVWDRVR